MASNWGENMLGYNFREAKSSTADTVLEQIFSVHTFAPRGAYSVYYASNSTRKVFKTGEYHSDTPHIQLGHIQSRDEFRPIAGVKIFHGL